MLDENPSMEQPISNGVHSTVDVLTISTSYPANDDDWKGIFIRHLSFALARRRDIRLSLWSPPGPLPPNATYAANIREERWLAELMRLGGIAHQFRAGGVRGKLLPLPLFRHLRAAYRRETADIYHVNWLQNVLPLPDNGRPVLATVLGTDMQLLKVPGMVSLLRHVLKARPVAICPNADWMAPELERLFGDMTLILPISFGLDLRWFNMIRCSNEAIPRWLCVTRLTQAKLGPLFEQCAPLFSHGRRELHLFGPMQEDIDVPDWVRYHGPTTPDALCNTWFPTATGLITLSQHPEGRPQVMLEAMAAGLPIIASDIPAHSNFLQHKETGWLCGSAHELPGALIALEDLTTNLHIGQTARRWARSEIGTWDDAADRYARVYRKLLAMSTQ